MQNCVWTNCAPAARLAARAVGCQSAGGSIGASAAPMKSGTSPAIARPEGSAPVSRISAAAAIRRASRLTGSAIRHRAAGDDEGLVLKPQTAMPAQHVLRHFEISAARIGLDDPLLGDLRDIDGGVPRRQGGREADAALDLGG